MAVRLFSSTALLRKFDFVLSILSCKGTCFGFNVESCVWLLAEYRHVPNTEDEGSCFAPRRTFHSHLLNPIAPRYSGSLPFFASYCLQSKLRFLILFFITSYSVQTKLRFLIFFFITNYSVHTKVLDFLYIYIYFSITSYCVHTKVLDFLYIYFSITSYCVQTKLRIASSVL